MVNLADLSNSLASQDFTSIPVIDLSDAQSPSLQKRKAVAAEIRNACLNAGFFYVKNHGVPLQVVDRTFEQSKEFFNQPDGLKKSVDISKSGGNFRGYMGLLSENNDPKNKGDMHEAFNMGLDPSVDASAFIQDVKEGELRHSENLWPDKKDWQGADVFKQANLDYYKEVLGLGQSLFPLFALALDLPEDFFSDKIEHPAAIMRILFYPALGERQVDELMPGIGAHTDFECFTILRQDDVPSALQVQNRKGQWVDAPYMPDTFVINIGDQFARWTNDIFVSTRHRVLPALSKDRYSIPFFFGCDHDVPLIPPDTCVTADRPAKYETMTAGAYVHMRLSDIYKVKET
ncbi:hypothetical protein CNBC4500 [Cryptococcus deneoformans B-3501A]|uniref:hypothetical protein n=1 Tax=Cryptococcus deneoformans (strain B-3501A) TaxID=283643 RepID=UPI000042EF5D|nr:hypothetical protein CNBC4500 [Cryptococcus neoformans var. neoformans B-3501A]EAL21748.1 hypothetical protein CNBC4500 [Cryptococcus neoformans var. neoformans B-3501A]